MLNNSVVREIKHEMYIDYYNIDLTGGAIEQTIDLLNERNTPSG